MIPTRLGLIHPFWRLLLCSIVCLYLFASCGVVITNRPPAGKSNDQTTSTQNVQDLHIPPGHLPPPGSCRIWVPGAPPGQQSPPGSCADLERRVPRGAWLLRRDTRDPKHIEVLVYHARRPSVVIEIRYFDASSGRFLHASTP